MTALVLQAALAGTSQYFAASNDTRAHGALSLLMLSSVEEALTVARLMRGGGLSGPTTPVTVDGPFFCGSLLPIGSPAIHARYGNSIILFTFSMPS